MNSSIVDRVWQYLRLLLREQAAVWTPLEWDNDVPPYPILGRRGGAGGGRTRVATGLVVAARSNR